MIFLYFGLSAIAGVLIGAVVADGPLWHGPALTAAIWCIAAAANMAGDL